MTGPVRLRLSRAKGFNLQEYSRAVNGLLAVKVCRPGRWGNPFAVSERIPRELTVEMFRDRMNGFFDPGKIKHLTDTEFSIVYDAKTAWEKRTGWGAELQSGARRELRGKNLACWCRPDQACHADVLLKLANGFRCDAPSPRCEVEG